jgi:hypothetical protein
MHIRATLLLVLISLAAGCGRPEKPIQPRSRYASAEQVEMHFRGRHFVLGDNDTIALVRPPDWPKDRWLHLPFWLGINVLVPGVTQPKEGDYYVISEAHLGKPLGTAGEWMIEAGSTLVRQQAVFVTTRTHYLGAGKILPTIVQYFGRRTFTSSDGRKVEVPVLREVSLPMSWTLGGPVPSTYARYRIE